MFLYSAVVEKVTTAFPVQIFLVARSLGPSIRKQDKALLAAVELPEHTFVIGGSIRWSVCRCVAPATTYVHVASLS